MKTLKFRALTSSILGDRDGNRVCVCVSVEKGHCPTSLCSILKSDECGSDYFLNNFFY